ncbi:hypothetical protein Y032_1034g3453 [Ancylostoma ceylanicum]|uniref:Uncharacterized protein n=1 Tax=Ancylostoma ceylanicum TaxID=53326 RepID=A0A016W7G7_9BILA|nr:hypothetical protein Y032_1034g3453 [Ancylostoma ceylanicum]
MDAHVCLTLIYLITNLQYQFVGVMFMVVVVLLQLAALVEADQRFTDSCFVGTESQLNSSFSTACPLIPRIEFKHQYESSCSVSLGGHGIKNSGCTPCYWKERLDAMCYPIETHTLRHCCCRTPDCNRRLMEDALFGWGENTPPKGYCMSAELKVNASGIFWTHRLPEKCPKADPWCIIKLALVSNEIKSMEAGCLQESKHGEKTVEDCKSSRLGEDQMDDGDGFKIWCCYGETCSRKIYKEKVFEKLQEVRLKNEDAYFELIHNEMSTRSEHVWANDRSYLSNQPIFESVIYMFTTMYLIGLYYIYATYKPKDMHKLPQMPRSKNIM